MKETLYPSIDRDLDGDATETHPAYAQISASRVSGGMILYGSEFHHQHFITVSICKSELRRSHARDRAHTREEYIEVAMSEAQWASFISTMNMGSGTQCTLNHLQGKMVPAIHGVPDRKKQFNEDILDRLKIAEDALVELQEALIDSKLSGKSREKMISLVGTAITNIKHNLQFVADQFGEHMEHVRSSAKAEISAFFQNIITKHGLKKLTSPVNIGDDDGKRNGAGSDVGEGAAEKSSPG
jgi:hypothetical protein